MKFHDTDEEEKLFEEISQKHPDIPYDMVSLMVWCWINRRDKYLEIVEKYTGKEDVEYINLEDIDYKKIFAIES